MAVDTGRMLLMVLCAGVAGATVAPRELKTFKDWTVGCDNGRSCRAVSLVDEAGPVDGVLEYASLVVERGGAGNDMPRVLLRNDVAAVAISIDGVRYPLERRGGLDEVVGAPLKVVAAVANAKQLLALGAGDTPVAVMLSAGASAALRFIDDQQKRAGTTTALVARGPGTRVPAPPALPVIKVPPASSAPPAKVKPADTASFTGDNDCDADPATFAPELARLDATHTLVVVPSLCGNGAYNFFSTVLIVDNAGKVGVASFDAPTGMGGEDDGSVVNVSYDPKSRQLSTFAKGRGIGDCGTQQDFAWDGKGFCLVEQREMGECRGAIDSITTWRATVR